MESGLNGRQFRDFYSGCKDPNIEWDSSASRQALGREQMDAAIALVNRSARHPTEADDHSSPYPLHIFPSTRSTTQQPLGCNSSGRVGPAPSGRPPPTPLGKNASMASSWLSHEPGKRCA